jgi:hypothetical protein
LTWQLLSIHWVAMVEAADTYRTQSCRSVCKQLVTIRCADGDEQGVALEQLRLSDVRGCGPTPYGSAPARDITDQIGQIVSECRLAAREQAADR